MPVAISSLVPQVQSRLEELAGPSGDGEFWSIKFELRTAILEAISDLLTLVGRPTQTVSGTVSIVPNNVFQTAPSGILMITDIYGSRGQLRKVSLHDMDYVQSSWGPDWENDSDAVNGPVRWFPLGFNMFGVHPAPTVTMNLTYTAIAYPTTNPYPYLGSETVPFHDELFASLEEYAAVYARTKEGGPELQQALTLYRDYLNAAYRFTAIEDRRDPVIFSPSFGAIAGTDSLTKR